MNVKMLEPRKAAPDGTTIVELDEGSVYDLPEALATNYIDRGLAEAAEATDEAPVPWAPVVPDAPAPGEAKSDEAAPENKADGPAPENKSTAKPRARRRRAPAKK